jgi:DNA-binding CsgD family transcriptional regulator
MHWWQKNKGLKSRLIWIAILGTIAVSFVVDLLLDEPAAVGGIHIALESLIVFLAFGSAVFLGSSWLRTQKTVVALEKSLAEQQTERDQWRQRTESLLRGLGIEIDSQLRIWGLTPAERETALLLLKGYGHKEIALLFEKSERTVRHQAAAVYRKSRLAGRVELSAFFLEHLLLPQRVDAGAREPGDAAQRSEEDGQDPLTRVH